MAVCLISQSLTKDNQCAYSLPQIVEIYLANFADVTGTTLDESKQEVKGITLASGKKFYKVEPAKNSASWSDVLQTGANGNKFKVQTIGFTYNGAYNADMVDVVDALALGKFVAVARLADGSYVMLGRLTGLEADSDGVSNTASGDASAESGMTVSLTANTTESALPLSAEAIETVVSGSKE